jgi:hypothetical protein
MTHSTFSLALLAALVFSAPSVGAQTGSGKHFARYTKPLSLTTLDLATGTVTRGPSPRSRTATTIVDFDNLDLGGFIGVDTGGGFCEWFEAGVKGTGMGATFGVNNNSDLMNSIVFAYCSAKASVGSGGPGGSTKLGFYEGYVQFGGTPTTTVAAFTLTGLPANSTSSSFFGGFNCYFVRVFFPTLICFADGPIGYSWKFLDNGTGTINPIGAVLAGTWPFLACVMSCSAACPSVVPDGQGMLNGIDRYCPPGNLLPFFCFGTTSGSFESISMRIEEVVDQPATVTGLNSATQPNPDILSGVAPVVGQPWSASLTLGISRTKGGTWICYFGNASVNPPNGIPIPQFTSGLNFGPNKAGRMLLCNITGTGFNCVGSHTGVFGSVSSTNCGGGSLPKTIGLVCNSWCAQAVVLGQVAGAGNARLSSALQGIVGTN